MKKQVILRGMAWGHVLRLLIERELAKGQLLSLAGRHFPGVREELVAARRRARAHGPVAERLWQQIEVLAPEFGRWSGAAWRAPGRVASRRVRSAIELRRSPADPEPGLELVERTNDRRASGLSTIPWPIESTPFSCVPPTRHLGVITWTLFCRARSNLALPGRRCA
jgi:hypothetical protein